MMVENKSLWDIHLNRAFFHKRSTLYKDAARKKNQQLEELAPPLLRGPLEEQRVLEHLSQRGGAGFRVDLYLFQKPGEADAAIAELQKVWENVISIKETRRTKYNIRFELTYVF